MAQWETTSGYWIYNPGDTREIAILRVCNIFGKQEWEPFGFDYEKQMVFFKRKVNPDREGSFPYD